MFTSLRQMGFEYFKLDFLTSGIRKGGRYDPTINRLEAYRAGLGLMVEAIGEGAYVVGCGAPLGCSVGLLDGCRIGPDTEMSWHKHWLAGTVSQKDRWRRSL